MADDRREHALTCLREDRIMAVLRQVPLEHLVPLADVLVESGVRSLEITHDYDRATDDVALLVERFGIDASVGVGTTWSVEQAETASAAGSTFCVLPGIDAVTAIRSYDLGMLTVPGVQTPAEIQLAIRSHADVLKFFPADPPGAAWLAQVAPAYRQRPFMATGGVTIETMGDFFDAGAIAVGMGDTLFGRVDDIAGARTSIQRAVAVVRDHGAA
jgi:2-dehydro-3-deoxyphosphogluconate aldolase/(4S)-4-hydroxy-2-oxoglutarate aldolase